MAEGKESWVGVPDDLLTPEEVKAKAEHVKKALKDEEAAHEKVAEELKKEREKTEKEAAEQAKDLKARAEKKQAAA